MEAVSKGSGLVKDVVDNFKITSALRDERRKNKLSSSHAILRAVEVMRAASGAICDM